MSVEYFRHETDTWSANWKDSLEAADDHWGDINQFDGFLFLQQPNVNWGTDCGFGASPSTVDRGNLGDGPLGVLMITSWCDLAGEKFYLFIDTAESWYFTSGDDFVNGTASARGYLTHEFGHATNFGGAAAPQHFTSACDSSDLGNYQTMCSQPPFGDQDNAWRWTTLEIHDVHEFQSAY